VNPAAESLTLESWDVSRAMFRSIDANVAVRDRRGIERADRGQFIGRLQESMWSNVRAVRVHDVRTSNAESVPLTRGNNDPASLFPPLAHSPSVLSSVLRVLRHQTPLITRYRRRLSARRSDRKRLSRGNRPRSFASSTFRTLSLRLLPDE